MTPRAQKMMLAALGAVTAFAIVYAIRRQDSSSSGSSPRATPASSEMRAVDADFVLSDAPGGGKIIRVNALGIESWLGDDHPKRTNGSITTPFFVILTEVAYTTNGAGCSVGWHQRAEDGDHREPKQVLDDLQKEWVRMLHTRLLSSREITLGDIPGRELLMYSDLSPNTGYMRQRHFVRDRIVYTLHGFELASSEPAETKRERDEVEHCFESFRLHIEDGGVLSVPPLPPLTGRKEGR